MAWLLDTNAWITYLKTPQSSIRSRLQSLQPTDVVLCSVVKAELLHGAEKYGNRERRLGLLRELFAPYVSHPFDDTAATAMAAIIKSFGPMTFPAISNSCRIRPYCAAAVSSNGCET